uniref:Chromatin target of PRMT1 protein C-terminal domain-containing protein n=1 Tax=Clastoptera arizonana TaxID=38151 RepID=A0A1B6CAY1_9HEMI
MERRPTVLAALKLKKRSLKQRLGQATGNQFGSVKDRLLLSRGSFRGRRGTTRGGGSTFGQGISPLRQNRDQGGFATAEGSGRGANRGRGGGRLKRSFSSGNLSRSQSMQSLNGRGGTRGKFRGRSRSQSRNTSSLRGLSSAGRMAYRRGNRGAGRGNENFRSNRGGARTNQRGGGGGRGRWGGNNFRGRGGRGGGRGMRNGNTPTKEELDNQLDQYMSNTKGFLDKELDSYMKHQNEEESWD